MTGLIGFKCALRRAFLHGHVAPQATATAGDVSTAIIVTDEPQAGLAAMEKVYQFYLAKGKFTLPDGTVEPMSSVNWLALLSQLIADLPQLLAILLPLIGG